MSAAWENSRTGSGSSIARHEWKGLSKMPGALEDFVERKRLEGLDCPQGQSARMRVPGSFNEEFNEDL
jgi:DDB1- and CUL4-associated factor 11